MKMMALAASALVSLAHAHKILMSGSLEKSEAEYYRSIAQALANNPEYENTVYILHSDIEEKANFEITQLEDRLFTI